LVAVFADALEVVEFSVVAQRDDTAFTQNWWRHFNNRAAEYIVKIWIRARLCRELAQ
jgi:hypothetical protein